MVFQQKSIGQNRFHLLTGSACYSKCEYLGLPSPPPMFVLSSMRSDYYDDWIYMCALAAMVCVLVVKSESIFG